MRVHFSFIFTALATLLLVSGTVGCITPGNPWYNPTTATITNPLPNTFSNPFSTAFSKPSARDNASRGPSSLFADSPPMTQRPSLDATPNIGIPQGGYTDRTFANHQSGSTTPPASLGIQSPMAASNPSHAHGGFTMPPGTMPEPSQYMPFNSPPAAQPAHHMAHQAVPAQDHSAFQFPPVAAQQVPPFHHTAAHQAMPQQPMGNVHVNAWEQPNHHIPSVGHHSPQMGVAQHDHFAAHQQMHGSPQGFGHGQMPPTFHQDHGLQQNHAFPPHQAPTQQSHHQAPQWGW